MLFAIWGFLLGGGELIGDLVVVLLFSPVLSSQSVTGYLCVTILQNGWLVSESGTYMNLHISETGQVVKIQLRLAVILFSELSFFFLLPLTKTKTLAMLLGLLFLKGKDEQDECSQCDKIQPNTLKTIIWVWQKHLVFVYKKPFFFFFFFF